MKSSKEYAKKTGKLFRSLKQKHSKVTRTSFADPLDAVIYATISEHMSESAAKSVVKRLERQFVNLNELRVSRTDEILELLGGDSDDLRRTASQLTQTLNSVFNKYNRITLCGLREIGKRQARKELEELGIESRFVINYCFITALGGHAIPLTAKMFAYLKSQELVHPNASEEEIEGFLERQITIANGYTFYSLLRRESEKGRKTRKKTVKKKSTAKKTEKSTKKAKKTTKKKTGKS